MGASPSCAAETGPWLGACLALRATQRRLSSCCTTGTARWLPSWAAAAPALQPPCFRFGAWCQRPAQGQGCRLNSPPRGRRRHPGRVLAGAAAGAGGAPSSLPGAVEDRGRASPHLEQPLPGHGRAGGARPAAAGQAGALCLLRAVWLASLGGDMQMRPCGGAAGQPLPADSEGICRAGSATGLWGQALLAGPGGTVQPCPTQGHGSGAHLPAAAPHDPRLLQVPCACLLLRAGAQPAVPPPGRRPCTRHPRP